MVEEKEPKPLCHDDCWHYGSFGGEEGCEQKHGGYGGWPEPIQPGQECLYPKKKDIVKPSHIGSFQGLCAALEGSVIEGGPHDNTQLVEILTGSKVKKPEE